MKIYLAIKFHPDLRNRPRIEQITQVLEGAGAQTVCIHRDVEAWGSRHFSPQELMRRSFAEIDACDLLLVEATEKGVGLGIEAGYARARDIPIVVAVEHPVQVSTTLQGIARQVICYRQVDELAAVVKF